MFLLLMRQVEGLTKNTKHKSGWSFGWKKVTKSFQSKDPALMEHHRFETTPLPRTQLSEHMDVPALPPLRTSKSDILLPKTPRADTTLLPKTPRVPDLTLHPRTPRASSLPVPKTPKAELTSYPKTLGADSIPSSKTPKAEFLQSQKTPRPDFKPTSAVTKSIPLKQENVEPQSSFEGVHEVLKVDTPTSNSKRSGASSVQFKDRCKEDYITNHRSLHVGDEHRRQRSRSTSPDYIRQHKHREESDSVSVTTTSSHSTTSTTLSNRSGHVYRGRDSRNGHRRDYYEGRHDRSTSRTASHNHLPRHRHRSSHKSGRSLGHEREFSAERSYRSRQHRLEHHGPSHRKRRQKELSGHRSTSHRCQNDHDIKDHHYMDSHSLHISTDLHLTSTSVHGSGHQRYKDGSVSSYHGREGSEHHSSHRSSHRKDHYKEDSSKHSSQPHRHSSYHRRKEFFE